MTSDRQKDRIAKVLIWASAALILLVLSSILLYVFVRGIGSMSIPFLLDMPANNWREGWIFSAIAGTLMVVAVAVIFAAPVGVGASVYLAEFTREGRLTKLIRIAADSLNAIPSIIYGLFGLALFMYYLKDYTGGASMLSAGLTLGLMILPTIIRTSEVSIKTVPMSEKLGSYALGATKLQTIGRIVIPRAIPGIATGIILGIGRAAGETAPIVFMMALNPVIPNTFFGTGNALTTTLYYLTSEGISIDRAFGVALTLMAMVLALNYLTRAINTRLTRNQRA